MLRGFAKISGYENDGIPLPERKTAYSAGYDIAAAQDVVLPPQKVSFIPTGLKVYMQADEFFGVHIRSSMAIKHSLSLINGQGIIDADYYNNETNEGHILIAVFNHGEEAVRITKGTRVAQGIFYKYLRADEEKTVSASRTGGLGSTGQ
ncbi:deoxyuridine triphosphate nucleotidohydrolase/deoxycytidine triphosphate deaminase [Lucifera butyrica]|uniref:dUTP diphosphatase n=1 Tax=Lucifera butyrica TaxID=1351585 RepID=A0A498RG14_9FIRM|nr:dUTP diphosphatase [Lucifera butyrica]VBB08038.1 deoxyuridine triphosphate nucleotidohydrolase/deoxycytidine triphosphate deaminase [Lucifera butyrica]